MTPRDHLLRLVACVAPGTRVVHIACDDGALTADLTSLGLEVWACDGDPERVAQARVRLARGPSDADDRVTVAQPTALGYPDAFAPWVVLDLGRVDDASEALAEAARVIEPGGWIWTGAPTLDGLLELTLPEALVPAETPRVLQGAAVCVFRRVGVGVVA